MKIFYSFILTFILSSVVFSQEVLIFFEDMPAICDPTELSGLNLTLPAANDDGFFDSDKCDGTRENVVYLSFIAWTDDMEMQFIPTSCSSTISDPKRGIQVSVFTLDENGDVIVIDDLCECNNMIETVTLMLNGLIPGEQYFIFIDGCAGDICDVGILLPLPVSSLPPFSLPANISLDIIDQSGEGIYCEGEEVSIQLTSSQDSEFTLDYVITEIYSDGSSVQQNINSSDFLIDTIQIGIDTIIYSVDVYNPCDTIFGLADTLVVSRFEKEVFPADTICPGDTLNLMAWLGSDLFLPTFYSDTISLSNGCELVQEIELNHYLVQASVVDTFVCSFPVIYEGNIYNTEVQDLRIEIPDGDQNGCDSIVSLNISQYIFDGQFESIDCRQDSTTLGFVADPAASYDSLIYQWTVSGVDMGINDTVIIGTAETAELLVDVYNNGEICQFSFGPFQPELIEFSGSLGLNDCQGGIISLEFFPSNTDYDNVVYSWQINGVTQSNDSNTLIADITDVIILAADVTKGTQTCSFELDTVQFWQTLPFDVFIEAISCIDDSISLEVEFLNDTPDSVHYSWLVDFLEISNEATAHTSNMDVVELRLEVFYNGVACQYVRQYQFSNEIPCNASCIPANLTLGVQDTLCWNGIDPVALDLTAVAVSNMGVNGQGMWLNPEVNNVDNTFVPSSAVDSNYVLQYEYIENGDCIALESIVVSVLINNTPIVSSNITEACVDQVIPIMSLFSAGVDNAFWFLNGASVISGDLNSGGLVEISFPTEGIFGIFVETYNESCSAQMTDSLFFEISAGAQDFSIDCNPEIDQILFTWQGQECIDNYQVFVNGTLVNTQNDTFYLLDQLDPLELVNVEVVASEGCICGNMAQGFAQCQTSECPPVEIMFEDELLSICQENANEIQLAASYSPDNGNSNSSWNGVGLDANGVLSTLGLDTGVYNSYYTVEDGACTYVDSMQVEILRSAELEVKVEVDSCGSNTDVLLKYLIVHSNGVPTVFIDNQPVGDSPIVLDLAEGLHEIRIEDEFSCTMAGSFIVDFIEYPDFSFTGLDVVTAGEESSFGVNVDILDAYTAQNLIWTLNGEQFCEGLGCEQVTVESDANFELCAELIYNQNCSVLSCREVKVETKLNYYLPNAFSPFVSVDINDEWAIFTNVPEFSIESLKIYDRWGNLVHELQNEIGEEGKLVLWDGRMGDRRLNSGVFVYLLSYEFNGEQFILDGQLTLIN